MSEQERRKKSKKKKQCAECQEFTWIGSAQEKCEQCEKQTPVRDAMEDKDEEQQQRGNRRTTGGKDDSCCSKCKVTFKKGDNSVECDSCKKWFHCGCGKCSINLFKVLKEEKDVLWFCYNCRTGVLTACEEVNKLREENKKVRQELREYREQNEELADSIR
ncbi:hypothetical protein Pcinc_010683 [Petrolisthes cinctipes]|uniref:PHD-type domain-containing protein n=1 Tax=Petrolisthes cinctipes TaxID=88211 RepID=A0AAE1G270_PETCI|nr:hypothetical protein Pcinc_010683 [Petrolisthes cinctipes]